MKPLSIPGIFALALAAAACGPSGTPVPNGQEAAGPGAAAGTAQAVYSATGNVTAISGDRVTIAHGPVEGLGWPAMTMTFTAGDPTMLQGVSVGDRVTFQFRQSGNDYPLTALSKAQ